MGRALFKNRIGQNTKMLKIVGGWTEVRKKRRNKKKKTNDEGKEMESTQPTAVPL